MFALADATTGNPVHDIPDSQQEMIASGVEWTRTVCSMPKKLADSGTVTAKVDVLDFLDGSI
ncbi:MAG: hypothetical protein WB630_00095 [Candidatus Acidiferrales bacterium]